MEPLRVGDTLGILGGGQLARMLCAAAARLGLTTVVLEAHADCPAAQTASAVIVAPYDDADALAELGRRADVITYEFENVDVASARELARTVPVLPAPRALGVAQDRLREKEFLEGAGVPVAPWRQVDAIADLEAALAAFGGGVCKTRRGGYDGHGQAVFRPDDPEGWEAPAAVFERLAATPGGLVLEAFVPFACEISVIATRARDGSIVAHEPAHNRHEGGILRRSTVPCGLAANVRGRAADHARALLSALDYVGTLGLELFVLDDGSLLANEFAPRVHNSGHWTVEACRTDQFENHVRAVAGWPLGDGSLVVAGAVMDNLLGDEAHDVAALLADPRARVTLYGKRAARPGRKMGHVTRIDTAVS